MVVAIALLVGCRSGSKSAEPPEKESTTPGAKATGCCPTVSVATAVAADDGPAPMLLILDDAGELEVAAVERWTDLTGPRLPKGARSAHILDIERVIAISVSGGKTPKQALAELDAEPDYQPEEPPKPSDDDTGGTGTAMALEEGRMGKKDAPEDPALKKRREVIEVTGPRGAVSGAFSALAPDDPDPYRVALHAGEVVVHGKLPAQRAALLASPRAKASKMIEVLDRLDAAIAVAHGKSVRPLRIDFRSDPSELAQYHSSVRWLEARLSATGVTIEAVPATPVVIEWEKWPLDQPRLEAALANARTKHGLDPRAPVDVLVDPEIDAQRLVDLIVALDTAGVTMIGLGPTPSANQLKTRGR